MQRAHVVTKHYQRLWLPENVRNDLKKYIIDAVPKLNTQWVNTSDTVMAFGPNNTFFYLTMQSLDSCWFSVTLRSNFDPLTAIALAELRGRRSPPKRSLSEPLLEVEDLVFAYKCHGN